MENTISRKHGLLLVMVAIVVAGGCRSSGNGSVGDVTPTGPEPVPPAPTGNTPPDISGTPPEMAVVGQTYSFRPQAQDSDGDSLVFSIENRPVWATFSSSTGELTGTPESNHEGTSSDVTISVTDGTDTTNLLPFDLRVRPRDVLVPPVFASVAPAGTIFANTFFDFIPLLQPGEYGNVIWSIRNRPGWATFDSQSGRLSGTPANNDAGTYDAITITATNLAGSADLGPFTLVVIPASSLNSPPVISGEPPTTAIVAEVYSFTPEASDPNGDDLVFAVSGKPGWLAFDKSTGQLRGVPSPSHIGLTGSISIAVSDGEHTRNLQAFRIEVRDPAAGNSAPVISGSPDATAVVDQSWSFTPNASDADGDSLSFSIAGKPAWAAFNTSTGTLSGTPVESDLGTFPNIRITVSDGTDSASLTTFSVEVVAGNVAPVISGTPVTVAVVGEGYQFEPDATDANGDTLTFSVAGLPAWAVFDTQTGRISGTPTIGDVGETPLITISVSDGELESSLTPFSISVEDQVITSVVVGSEDSYVKETTPDDVLGEQGKLIVKDDVLQMGFVGFDVKPQDGRSLLSAQLQLRVRFVLEPGAVRLHRIRSAWSEGDVTFRTAPTYAASPDFQFTVTAEDEGRMLTFDVTSLVSKWLDNPDQVHGIAFLPAEVAAVFYSAESGDAMQLTMQFTSANEAQNIAPSVDAGEARSGLENQWILLNGHVSDDGLPQPPGETLVTWYKVSGPGNVEFEDGTKASTRVRIDQTGDYVLKLAGDDGEFVSEDQVAVTVSASNGAPAISGRPSSTATVGQAWSFRPEASDPDGDELSFSIKGRPAWTTFNGATGELGGTPGAADVGTYGGITISVSDGANEASLPAFSVTVAAANNTPSISGNPSTEVAVGSQYVFRPAASDPDGDTLTFSISGRPSWAEFQSGTGRLSGTPQAGDEGTYGPIKISVSDGTSTATLDAFEIQVIAAEQATGSATLNWDAPTQNTDGSSLTNLAGYRIYGGPSGGTIKLLREFKTTGVTTFIVENLERGTHNFEITAVNSNGVESSRSNRVSKTIQ